MSLQVLKPKAERIKLSLRTPRTVREILGSLAAYV